MQVWSHKTAYYVEAQGAVWFCDEVQNEKSQKGKVRESGEVREALVCLAL